MAENKTNTRPYDSKMGDYDSRVPTTEEKREYDDGAKARAAKIKMYQDEYDAYKKPAPKSVNKRTGGKVSSASSRADGCCIRGKTRA